MAHYSNKITAIREYFALDGKPVPIGELKALTSEDRAELVAGIIAAGNTIEGE